MTPEAARRRAQRLREQAAGLIGEATALEAYAAEVERLRASGPTDKIRGMTPAHRLRISAARGGGALAAAARARGHSLRSLAREIGCSQALLSQIDAGASRLTDAMRERLRAAIGWPSER